MIPSYGPERGQYVTDFDDCGAVEELRSRAFQRHQNRQNPLGIDPLQGPIMILSRWDKDSAGALNKIFLFGMALNNTPIKMC